jgi:hypothetical protein
MRFPDSPRDLGLVTTAEALLPRERGGLELTQRALRWRVDSGRWQRLHNGVYLMGNGRVDWPARAAAALLAYGDAAALCDRSAGFLQGLVSDPGDVIHVLVPRAARPHHHTGTRLHRSDRRRVISGWPPRTAYETTVLDLATSPRADDLASLLATALRGRRTTEARLALALKDFRTHPQRRLLTDLLGASAAGSVGALEVRFGRDVLRRHGLPEGGRPVPSSRGRPDPASPRNGRHGRRARPDPASGTGPGFHRPASVRPSHPRPPDPLRARWHPLSPGVAAGCRPTQGQPRVTTRLAPASIRLDRDRRRGVPDRGRDPGGGA